MTFTPEIVVLMLLTLIAVLAFAILQYTKAQQAKREKSHSAMTEGRPDQRATDGPPGVKRR